MGKGVLSVTLATGQAFAGQSNLIAVTSNIALQGCSDGDEPAVETDYLSESNGSGSTPSLLRLVGSSYSFTNKIVPESVAIAYGPPGMVVDEFPSAAGRTWTNPATRTYTLSDGPTSYQNVRTINADGSYTDVSANPGFEALPYNTFTSIENSDGSGSVTQVAGANASAAPYVTMMGAPTNGTVIVSSSGAAPVDPLLPSPTPCATNAAPCKSGPPTPYPVHAWYPYTPSATYPLETISSTDKGVLTLPSTCPIATGYPSTADLVETIDATLDVYYGTSSVVSDAYVDLNAGLLCLSVSSTETFYQFGATAADTTPIDTETFKYTQVLEHENVPTTSTRRTSTQAAGGAESSTARAVSFALAHAFSERIHPRPRI